MLFFFPLGILFQLLAFDLNILLGLVEGKLNIGKWFLKQITSEQNYVFSKFNVSRYAFLGRTKFIYIFIYTKNRITQFLLILKYFEKM